MFSPYYYLRGGGGGDVNFGGVFSNTGDDFETTLFAFGNGKASSKSRERDSLRRDYGFRSYQPLAGGVS